MATRNILDSLGNVIGTMTLPDETTEDQWTSALNPYTIANPVATIAQIIETELLKATGNVTTSSGTPSTVSGMTKKPTAGKYLVDFNAGIYTDGASATGEFGIYVDGVLLQETLRPISCNLSLLGGLVTISLNSIGVGTLTGTEITLDGNQTVEVKFRSTNGGTIGFSDRVFRLIKVK